MVIAKRDPFIDKIAKGIAGDRKALDSLRDKERDEWIREFYEAKARRRSRPSLVAPPVGIQPTPRTEGAERFFFPEQDLFPVSERTTALRPITEPPAGFKMPVGELQPLEEEEISFGQNPTYWLWQRKLLPEFMFSTGVAKRDIRRGEHGLPAEVEPNLVEARRREGLANDPNILIRIANTPTAVLDLTPTDFVALGLISYSGYQAAKVGWDAFLRISLNRNLNSWAKSAGVDIPSETKNTFVNQAMANLSRKYLSQQAIRTIFRPTKAGFQAAPETVNQVDQDIFALVQREATVFVPRGTQTGAMAFGGATKEPIPPSVLSIASKIVNRIPLTPEEEQFRFNNKEAVETALRANAPVFEKVTPEVTRIEPTYENLAEGQTLIEKSGERWEITTIKKEGVPAKWAYTIKALEQQYAEGFTMTRPLGEIERYYKIEQPVAIPKAEAVSEAVIGRETVAYGPDPTKSYQMRYRLIELEDLIPSHTDAFAPNPAYPKELQPRMRDRAASRLWVQQTAKNLSPEALVGDTHMLDTGLPIVGPDMVVESGNGRVLAMRQAQQGQPERWAAYQKALRDSLSQFGLTEKQLAGMHSPVIVRERLAPVDRVRFAQEANQAVVVGMSPLENALQDAQRIRFDNLVIPDETQSIDITLRMAGNRQFVMSFLETLPSNERMSLLDANGDLNLQGMQRIKAAMFARTYPGEAGRELTRIFFESREPIIRNIEDGMMASLPKMAKAEELVRSKQREADLGISEDLAKGLGMLATLKQRKLSVDLYLGQRQLFNRELTPFQERLLKYIEGIANSPRKVREFLGNYSDAVIASTRPEQVTMFKGIKPIKEELFNATIGREEEGEVFTQKAEFVAVPPTPSREAVRVEERVEIPEAKVEPISVRPIGPEAPAAAEVPIEPPSIPPSGVPPAEPPAGATTSPMPEPSPISGRPRTLTDLNREAKGMRALSPEARAAAIDANKPIAADELLYQMKPFEEHAKNLLGKDTPIKQAFRNTPGLKQITEIWDPAQMERTDPIAMIGVRKGIFEEIEIARARLAIMRWWHEAEELFGFEKVAGEMIASKVQPASGANVKAKWFGRIWDIVEHPDDYVLTSEQSANLKRIQDVFNQNLRDNQRVGVDVVELVDAYWKRIVLVEPSGKRLTDFLGGRIAGARKGWTRQRKFDDVRELIKEGYKLETDPRIAAEDRLESGIRTFSDQEARNAIKQLPGVEKPLERMESRYPQTLEGAKAARAVRDEAKKTFLKTNAIEDEITLRQAEADYITAMREVYTKKIEAGQLNIGELKLPNGRIAPAELVEEVSKWVDLPEIRTTRGVISSNVLAVTQLVRTTLTNVDLAAGFIQGQPLFYRNNLAWWRAQGMALINLVDTPYSYYAKNYQLIDEGVRTGAVSLPTEFLFSRRGLASIPTRVPIAGPVMKAFNRGFEGFIVTGQIELYRATRSGAIRRATGHITPAGIELEQEAMDALVSLGSAIRKELGTESYAILGVRPTQHTIEQLFLFASRFFRALTGFIGQSFTGGEGGREARRAMGSSIAGGLSLLIAVSWALHKKMPNLTDPDAPDWNQVAVGKTYFNPFGPFYPYFRTIARVSKRMLELRPDLAANEIKRFLQSKAGIPFRALDMLAQFGLRGEMRTFEGERIPRTITGVAKGLLGELAVPISIQEALEATPQGRPESVFGEVIGLIGRGSPYNQMDIMFQKEKDINPEGQSYRYAEPWQQQEMEKRFPEIAKLLIGRGQGKWADLSQKTAELDDFFFKQEEELARQFETQEITPDKFRTEYSRIQIERANRKIGVLTALELFGYGPKVPKERLERLQYLMANLPTDDKERALAQYYLNFEIAKDKAGIMNWDVLEAIQTDYEERWTDEQKDYVERNTGLREHPPLIMEFLEARENLRPYWELPELPRSIRKNYRAAHPDIDVLLVKWYGYKTVEPTKKGKKVPAQRGKIITEEEKKQAREKMADRINEALGR